MRLAKRPPFGSFNLKIFEDDGDIPLSNCPSSVQHEPAEVLPSHKLTKRTVDQYLSSRIENAMVAQSGTVETGSTRLVSAAYVLISWRVSPIVGKGDS